MVRREQIGDNFPKDEGLRVLATKTMAVRGFTKEASQPLLDFLADKHTKIPNHQTLGHNIRVIYPQTYPTPHSFIKDQSTRFRREPGAHLVGSIVFNR